MNCDPLTNLILALVLPQRSCVHGWDCGSSDVQVPK